MANPTKQRKPSIGKGGVPTPPGFEAHPERRHNGAWKKEATARYKLEKMLVLTADELNDKRMDKDQKQDEIRRIAAILCRVAYYNGQIKGELEAIKAYKKAEQGYEEAD